MVKQVPINLPDVVGKGYASFWHFKGRIRAVKGSRRSKKSKTMALWSIYHMMKHPQANMLVVRKTYRTLKDSCFTELKWAIKRLGVENLWHIKESPLELTYLPTGQKIYFRGLDDPLKITSIAVEVGVLCWMWIEEAYEITSEDDFDTLVESMLGDCPEGLWKQTTLTFNPWSDKTWIKKRFFDVDDPDVLAITTTYRCNEWLSPADRKVFEDMKVKNPRRFKVAGEGDWGVIDGLIYENWKEQDFTLISKKEYDNMEEVKRPKNPVFSDGLDSAFGLDFGYTNDPTTLFCGFLSLSEKKLYVWDEMYQKGLSNKVIYNEITQMGYAKESIVGDSAEPKSIDELKGYGLRIRGAGKGKKGFSKNEGIQWIQDLEIIIHPRCVNFLLEISTYHWKKDKFDKKLNEPEDGNDHLMDAMRYALERFIISNKWLY